MALKIEDITAELTAQPELKKALFGTLQKDFTESLVSAGMVVRTKEEDTTFLNNYESTVIPTKVQAQIGEKIKAVHDQYDADILELTGLKKGPNEKTYEFNKRVLKDLKEKAEKTGAKDDPVLADQIKTLTAKIKEYEGYVAPGEVEKLKGQYFTEHVGLRLGVSLEKKAIAVPAHVTDDKAKQTFIETQRRFIKNDFLSRFTAKQDDKGNIVYYEGDKILTDAKTAAPKTEAQLIEEHYAGYFIPEKKTPGGAGSGGNGGGSGNADVAEADLKTKTEVIAHLKKKGMTQGSQEFNKEYSRIIKEYAITEPGE